MNVLVRNNVNVLGKGEKPLLFVHGYGCDQNMWRFITPAFEQDYRLVLLDLVGSGKSDLKCYSKTKYASLDGHASDVLEICDALDLDNAIFVGHSVSAMIAVLAANRAPKRFSHLVLVGPSPCYINDGDYTGGFNRPDIDGLLEFLDSNFLGWSRQLAPAIMGVPERPELAEELTNSICRTDPAIAQHFGKVNFLSDHRSDVAKCETSSLILQCSNDIVAPTAVGKWLYQNMPRSILVEMKASGHCPHLSAPEETITAIKGFLRASI